MLLPYLFHRYTRLLLILILIIGSFCVLIQMNFQDDKTEQKPTITVETFQTIDGWGYSIFKDEYKIIKQSYIPAVPGYRPFTTSMQAYQTALLVKEKLENEEVPLITIEDLTTLGIDTN